MTETPRPSTAIKEITSGRIRSVRESRMDVSAIEERFSTQWVQGQGIEPQFQNLVVVGLSGVNAAMDTISRVHPNRKDLLASTEILDKKGKPNQKLIDIISDLDSTNGTDTLHVYEKSAVLLGVAAEASAFVSVTDKSPMQRRDGDIVMHTGAIQPFREGRDVDQWEEVGKSFGTEELVKTLTVSYPEGEALKPAETLWFGAKLKTNGEQRDDTLIVRLPKSKSAKSAVVEIDHVQVQGVPSVNRSGGFDALSNFADALHVATPHLQRSR